MRRSVSKQKRVAANVVCIILALMLVDFFSGLPFPIHQVQFRREERAHLVGPGQILGVEEIRFSWYETMIVSETEEGIILWVSGQDIDRSDLVYRKKNRGSTLLAAPGSLGYFSVVEEWQLPIVLLDENPRAARAELQFTLRENVDGEDFEKTYTLSAEREKQGYFLFTMSAENDRTNWPAAEDVAVQRFANFASNQEKSYVYQVPVRVRFYDGKDVLIDEEMLIVSGAPDC